MKRRQVLEEPRVTTSSSLLAASSARSSELFFLLQPALNLAAGVYLLSVLAGVSLLNEGEQGCHHAEDGADRGGGG